MPKFAKAVSISVFRLSCGWTRTFCYLKALTAQTWHSQHCVETDFCLLACAPAARYVCVLPNMCVINNLNVDYCVTRQKTWELTLKLRTNNNFFSKMIPVVLSDNTKYRWHRLGRRSGPVIGYFFGYWRFAGRGWFSYLRWGASSDSHRGQQYCFSLPGLKVF